MVSENTADVQPDPNSRGQRGALNRLISRVFGGLFGGAVETTNRPEGQSDVRQDTWVPEEAPAPPAAEEPRTLEQALADLESMLDRLEGQVEQQAAAAAQAAAAQEIGVVQQALGESFQRLGDALDQLGVYVQRLSEEASGLRLVESRLEDRLDELTEMLREGRGPFASEPAREREPVAPEEPQFWPNEKAVGIVLAEVPGFQGLMDAQRALSNLQEAEGASVVAYRNGEASLEVTLRAPISARKIVEGLRASTGHQLLIEEARPEAQRLRLRFVNGEGRG